MRAPHEAQGVARITPGVIPRMGLALTLCLAAIGLSACGSGSDDDAPAGTATTLSTAQQTVGADLLPPDAAIAGTATVSTDLAAEDLSPANASSASADELLPPA
jgi:hypothetical protein